MINLNNVYNISEAKTHFSLLLRRVDNGEEIYIAKAGKPRWNIVPMSHAKPKRVPGLGKGKMWVAPDAFSPEVDAEIAAMFEESVLFPDERGDK